MNKHRPTPNIHPAYQALYGQPDGDLNDRIKKAFSQLSDHNQDRALTFCEALVNDDQATVDRMKREIETELAYLQRRNAGGEA
jgi:hypothetical protein